MNRSQLSNPYQEDADRLLRELSNRQHLRPHQPIVEALQSACNSLGRCTESAKAALERLQINPAQSIGRLRRTQLIQLAQCTRRFWRQATDPASAANA